MGASRPSYNLLKRYGWSNLFRYGAWKKKWAWYYAPRDTFGKFICPIIGHGKTFTTEDKRVICKRCFREVLVPEVK